MHLQLQKPTTLIIILLIILNSCNNPVEKKVSLLKRDSIYITLRVQDCSSCEIAMAKIIDRLKEKNRIFYIAVPGIRKRERKWLINKVNCQSCEFIFDDMLFDMLNQCTSTAEPKVIRTDERANIYFCSPIRNADIKALFESN